MVRSAVGALRELGVAAEDRVAVTSWNRPELAALFFACGRLGAALVPLNARLTPTEREALIAAAAPVTTVDLPLPAPTRSDDEQPDLVPERVLAALFTSGTTGRPSLVELSCANFVASARASSLNLGAAPEHRWLGTLPLFHVGGLAMLWRCAQAGACLLLEAGFDATHVSALFDEGVTHASLVPTTLARLLDARDGRPFAGVQAVLIGGGPMSAALLERARASGLPVLQTYGLTEACSQVTTERLGEADGQTAGPPIDGVEVRVVDDGGAPVGVGAVGNIEVCGPTVAVGRGPWLATKDLGSLDARGRLTVAARRVDLIVTGGENVYPAEVEALVSQHPAVRDVAVVPVPHVDFGQAPVAVVVLGSDVSDEALGAWVRERIAHFKAPRAWLRLDALPRNAGGKLERRKLQALAMERLAARIGGHD